MYIGPCIIVIVEEWETNLISQFIKFYFISSMLNMFRILIRPSSGACDFSIVSPHWLCVLVSMCVGVSVYLGDTIEKSQSPDDGRINIRNMLSIEEVKWNLINCDIKFLSRSSTLYSIIIRFVIPRCIFKDKLELCVYLSDTTIRWKMYVYLLHKINMFRPYFHWPSSGWSLKTFSKQPPTIQNLV